MFDDRYETMTSVLVAVVLVGSFALVGTAPAAAQEAPTGSVNISAPSNVTTGTPTAFGVTLTVSDVENFSVSGDVTVRLKINGSTVSTQTVQLSDGQTKTVTLRHTFTDNGTYDVSVEGRVAALGAVVTRSDATTVTVEDASGGPTLPGQANPAADLDGDGLLEDTNGDGSFTVVDVSALLNALDSSAVSDNAASFDFNGDGRISVIDVSALLNMVV